MKRIDFVNLLAEKGYTKKDADRIITDVFDTLTQALVDGESVQLHGFVTFSVRDSAPRESVDVKTKERIVIPGHRAPRFMPGKFLKKSIKEGIMRAC